MSTPIRRAVSVSAPYLVASASWILVSDQLVDWWVYPEALTTVQTFKGWVFVLLSTAFIHLLAQRQFRAAARERQTALRLGDVSRRLVRAQRVAALGSWDVDLSSGALHCCDEVFGILGVESGDLARAEETLFERVHPDDREALRESVATFREEAGQLDETHRIVRSDGAVRWVRLRAEVASGDESEPRTVRGTVQDVTESTELRRAVDAQRRRMEALSHQLIEVGEQERKKLARELHDQLGQSLSLLSLHLQRARRSDDAREQLGEAIELASETLEQVRSLSLQLRPPMLDDLGLLPALEWLLGRYEQIFETELIVSPELDESNLPSHLRVPCYRIVQEAVSNAARHGDPARVEVELVTHGSRIELAVRDDGRGFDVERAIDSSAKGRSLGLISMAERARLNGGRCSIVSAPDAGTTIRATFDLDAA